MIKVFYLTEKAQDAYASMAPEACLDYDQVKSAVRRAYELVPEAYRQKFRRLKNVTAKPFVNLAGRRKRCSTDGVNPQQSIISKS